MRFIWRLYDGHGSYACCPTPNDLYHQLGYSRRLPILPRRRPPPRRSLPVGSRLVVRGNTPLERLFVIYPGYSVDIKGAEPSQGFDGQSRREKLCCTTGGMELNYLARLPVNLRGVRSTASRLVEPHASCSPVVTSLSPERPVEYSLPLWYPSPYSIDVNLAFVWPY